MLLSRLERSLLSAQRGPFLSPPGDGDGGGGNGDQGKNDANANSDANSGGKQEGGTGDDEKKIEFNAEQQKHIDKLIGDARKDAARIAADKAKADRDAADEADRKKREADDLKAKGEFETVEKQLNADLETAKSEATTLKAENDQLRAAIDTALKPEWDALEDDVKEYYPGADDDTLAKITWLPKGKALQAKLHPTKGTFHGNPPNPRSNGAATPEIKPLVNLKHVIG